MRVSLQVHTNPGGVRSCPVCLKKFDRVREFTDHTITHSVDGKYPCRVCGKTYPSFPKLRTHMGTRHSGKVLTCETCGFATTYRPYLENHMLIHSRVGHGVFDCLHASVQYF